MPQGNGDARVVDFNQARAQRLDEKRRKTERIFFKQLLSVYTVIGNSKMIPIDVVDVSEDGCAFQVPYEMERPWPTDATDVPLRLYFSQDTYLEIHMKIQNSRPAIEDNHKYLRYGCVIDRTTASYAAYQQFVKFLGLYAEQAHKDLGDVSVFYL